MALFSALTWVVIAYVVAAANIIFGEWLKTIVLTAVAIWFVYGMAAQDRPLHWGHHVAALILGSGAAAVSQRMVW